MINNELKNKIVTLKSDIATYECLASETEFLQDSETWHNAMCAIEKLKKELATCKSLLTEKPFVTIGDLVNFKEV